MTYLNDAKPSLEELAHHGVKGMKWGRRKTTDSGGGSGGGATHVTRTKERVSSDQIHLARANTAARMAKIYQADTNVRLATTKKGKDAALKEVDKYAKQIATSDDARIGSKYTRGEKAMLLIAGTMVLPVVGTAVAGAAIGINSRRTRKK